MQKYKTEKSLDHYQLDKNGFISPRVLMNWLQVAADNHAEILGVGESFCKANNLAWVVVHYNIEILNMPRGGQKLNIITWPACHSGARAVRDFEIRDLNGNIMVRVTSQWVLLNLETRRAMRLCTELLSFQCMNQRALDTEFEKLPEFDAENKIDFKCRFEDLDLNGHINNSVYLVCATESVPRGYRDNRRLASIEINFLREVAAETDSVTVHSKIEKGISRHKIESNGIHNANILCRWTGLK